MSENVEKPPIVGMKRIVTAICDHLPVIGKIREHKFTTTLGAGITFTKADSKWEGFHLSVHGNSPVWTASELRELGAECVEMAKYLERIDPKQPV